MHDRRRLQLGADPLLAPLDLQRAGDDAADAPDLAHFAASASSRHSAGVAGKSCRCTELSSPGCRFSQTSSIVNGRIGASHVVSRSKTWLIAHRHARRRGLSAPSQ